jgi:uncharacterized damage-inducible protein DinB
MSRPRPPMSNRTAPSLLEALLDSWERNNRILVNLLRTLPAPAFDLRAMDGSPTLAQLFTHMHFVRLVFVVEDAPEAAPPLPAAEWLVERDCDKLAAMLDESARAVREAVAGRLAAGRDLEMHYDHPILMLQHLIWHEGYHHGQMKLVLKRAGIALPEEAIGAGTRSVWMTRSASRREWATG